MKAFRIFILSALCIGIAHSQSRGFLDVANNTFASGWACNPALPLVPLSVNFFLDGNIFAGSTLANLPREPAVAQQCGGNGQHGFSFRFPQNIINILNNGQSHTISAFTSSGQTQLSNSPRTVQPPPSTPRGFLDSANATSASGWACDPSRPNQVLQVNVNIDGTIFAGTTFANLPREPAVGQQCGGNAQHGWVLNFPPNIVSLLSNGQSHSVSAFVLSFPGDPAPTQLSNSPRTVLVPIVRGGPPIGFLDSANATFASGWSCDPTLPTRFLQVNIVVDGSINAGFVTANLLREPAVGQQCGGNAQHGWVFNFPPNIVSLLSNGQPHTVAAFGVTIPNGPPVQLSASPRTVQVALPSIPRGNFDVGNVTNAIGWACDANRPNQALLVNILIDGNVVGTATANLVREPAVGQQCGGNSAHGFNFAFSANSQAILGNGQPHTISTSAILPSGSLFQLPGSPKTVIVVRTVPVGNLDVANNTFTAGWACDPTQPLQALQVNIVVDGTIAAGTVTANLPREPAVGQQCGGNSQHGWTFNFPPNIVNILSNGQPHTVAAFAVPFPPGAPPTELSNSPRTVQVTLPPTPPIGFLDAANTTSASGWTCIPTQPNTILQVNVVIDGTVFAGTVTANLPREPAVAQQCGGNGQHGWIFNFPPNIVALLSNGQPHSVAAFAVPVPTGPLVQLSNSPRTVQAVVFGPPRGFLDSASVTVATGWACDPTNPNTALTVNFVVDGFLNAGSTVANTPREPAVGQQCGGNSQHGFSFQFPANIVSVLNDGNPHTVAAFATAGTNQAQLSSSPRTVIRQ